MIRMFGPQMHIEVWLKLAYASILFSHMTSLMSLENWSVKSERINSNCLS